MKFLASLMAAAMFSLAMTACSNDDDKKDDGDPAADELTGAIADTRTLDASITYKLVGPLVIEEGGVLNIPAGTRIEANKSFNSYILVLMGGKININGTAEAPVVMTSASATPKEGDWGGLIINGKGRVTKIAPGQDNAGTPRYGSTEISSAFRYGGTVDNDNSGVIKYLVLEYTGASSSADVEHNGLTLNAVGSGTTIENIFVKDGADDGIEFFGGSVNVTNILVVNSDDDMFDFTQGYNGTLTNAYGIWESGYVTSESDPSGIEADGNHDGDYPTDTDQSNFTVNGVTFDFRSSQAGHSLIRVRREATATITNALATGNGTSLFGTAIRLDGNAGTSSAHLRMKRSNFAHRQRDNPCHGAVQPRRPHRSRIQRNKNYDRRFEHGRRQNKIRLDGVYDLIFISIK